ncbi:hypothetical protein Tco_1241624 [Tanacetum coccineum]
MLPCVAGVDLKSAKRHQILELEKMWMNFQRELELLLFHLGTEGFVTFEATYKENVNKFLAETLVTRQPILATCVRVTTRSLDTRPNRTDVWSASMRVKEGTTNPFDGNLELAEDTSGQVCHQCRWDDKHNAVWCLKVGYNRRGLEQREHNGEAQVSEVKDSSTAKQQILLAKEDEITKRGKTKKSFQFLLSNFINGYA